MLIAHSCRKQSLSLRSSIVRPGSARLHFCLDRSGGLNQRQQLLHRKKSGWRRQWKQDCKSLFKLLFLMTVHNAAGICWNVFIAKTYSYLEVLYRIHVKFRSSRWTKLSWTKRSAVVNSRTDKGSRKGNETEIGNETWNHGMEERGDTMTDSGHPCVACRTKSC